MAYSDPRTWANGDIVTASALNQDLRDNVAYLKGVADGVAFSGVQLTRVAATSISDSSDTTITWTAEVLDFGGWWSSGSNATTPAGAIPTGYTTVAVLVIARSKFAANGTGIRKISVLKNGSSFGNPSFPGLTGETATMDVTEVTTVAAGDTISVQLYQNSGGALNASETQLTVIRLAPAS